MKSGLGLNHTRLRQRKLVLLAAGMLACPVIARASTFTWDGSTTSGYGYFSEPDNWVQDSVPTTGADLIFDSLNTHSYTPTLNTAYTVNSVTFNASALSYTIAGAGNILTVGTGGIADNATNAETFTAQLAINAGQNWGIFQGTMTAAASVNLSSDILTDVVSSGATSVFSGSIFSNAVSSAGLVKLNPGLMVFNGAGTTSNLGSLNLSGGTTNLSAGTVAISTTSQPQVDGASGAIFNITGAGSVFSASGTQLIVGATSGHSGALNVLAGGQVSAGTIFAPAAGSAILNVSSGGIINTPALYVSFSGTSGSSGNATISGSGSVINAGLLTMGTSTNTGGMTINNSGSVLVSGVTTFGSNNFLLNISGGTFTTGGLSSQGTGSGKILLGNGSSSTGLTINGSSGINSSYSGTMSGNGIVVKSGPSTETFLSNVSSSALDVNAGQFNVSAGTYTLTSASQSLEVNGSGSLLVNSGAILDATALSTTGFNTIDGAGSGPTLTVSGAGSQYKGGNELILGEGSGHTGTLNVSSGGQVSSQYLYIPNNGKGVLSVSSNGLVTSGTLGFGGSGVNSSITLTSGGTLNITSIANFYDSTSNINISGGSFVTSALSSVGLSNTGLITLTADPSGGTALVINGASGNNTYSGTVSSPSSGGGGLLKTGGSTQILSGFLFTSGGLTVNGGTLSLTGNTDNAVGPLTVQSGNLSISAGSLTASAFSVASSVNVSGGTLNISNGAILYANNASNVTIDGTTSPTVNLTGNGTFFNASGVSVYVGAYAGHTGILNVSNGAQLSAGVLFVPGAAGNGVLNISGGSVVSSPAVYLGYAGTSGSSCVAIVSGPGSSLNPGALDFGAPGNTGVLAINNSGSVISTGVTTFDSSTFPLNISGGFYTTTGLSSQGTGIGVVNLLADPVAGDALTINGGSSVISSYSGALTGVGTLLKSGNGTQIITGGGNIGALMVSGGNFNITGGTFKVTDSTQSLQVIGGSLLVNSGATLDATGTNSSSGLNYVDQATMTVTGTGSRYLGGFEFNVGEFNGDTASLIVSSSAQVSCQVLYVPSYGTGLMSVSSGGYVSASTLHFGSASNPSAINVSGGAAMVVSGISYFLDNNSQLNVSGGTFTTGYLSSGSAGNGIIKITNPAGGTALTINGTVGASVYSGSITGTGTLAKTGGSTQYLTNGTSSIGALAMQGGGLNISGGSLALTSSTTASIYVSGGVLGVTNGASVTGTNALYIDGPTGCGITVTGAGSSLSITPGISIDDSNNGSLLIQQGGSVTTQQLFAHYLGAVAISSGGTLNTTFPGVAPSATSVASVTIDGPGSAWNTISLSIGGYGGAGGNGTVTLTNQGAVVATGTTALDSNNSTINVSGGTWTTGDLSSFNLGNGTILLTDPLFATALTINDATTSDSNTYSGTISGLGSLLKTGASTQNLNGNNTFTGAVSVNGGTLNMNNSAASSYQVNGATLQIYNGNATGPVFIESGGLVTGQANYSTVTLLPGATYLPGGYNGSFPAISGTAALIQPAEGGTDIFGTVNLDAPTTIIVNGTDTFIVFSKVNANGNAVTKTGTGTVQITPFQTSALTISAGTVSLLLTGGDVPLQAGTLAISSGATLDLARGSADITSTPLAAITSLVQSGYNNGKWNGNGIVSSSAAGDPKHLTAIGVIQNNQSGTALYTAAKQFEGITPGIADVLAKYTYYGDTNLDGKVDGSDYSRIDAACLADKTNPTAMTGWYNGDFNYDGVVNGSDYTLIDNAFNTQGAQLSAQIATPTAQLTGSTENSVPEPAGLALIVIGTISSLGRRRQRRASFGSAKQPQ